MKQYLRFFDRCDYLALALSLVMAAHAYDLHLCLISDNQFQVERATSEINNWFCWWSMWCIIFVIPTILLIGVALVGLHNAQVEESHDR